MYSNTLLAATCCSIIHFVFIDGLRYGALQDDKSEEDGTSEDHHSFVALIDIMFTDGTKRSCTGSIVHDNVVITAAHCFYSQKNKNASAELTASFVVIGTKHLFETGYEQYLPIERVLTHPKFQDWTADLALVYTFAGMTSDKPGTVIPLAGERTSTPVDSNVTVISWGRLTDDNFNHQGLTKIKKDHKGSCSDSTSQEQFPTVRNFKSSKHNHTRLNTTRRSKHLSFQEELHQQRGVLQIDLNEYRQQSQRDTTMKIHSRYLNNADEDKFIKHQRTEQHRYINPKKGMNKVKVITATAKKPVSRVSRNIKVKKVREPNWLELRNEDKFEIKSYYKNWRRQMGTEQNKLIVETFGFVNMHTCKRFIESAVPDKYNLKGTNDVVCYSTEGHYITDKDSGAPAIRQGRLIAVTIGGIEYDDDHIAVGMKMNCYCSWIIDNLPLGSSDVKCCKNCCDINHGGRDKPHEHTNKYI